MNLYEYLSLQTSKRKLRLFGVACCQEIIPLLKNQKCIQAINAVELYADGLITKNELRRIEHSIDALTQNPHRGCWALDMILGKS